MIEIEGLTIVFDTFKILDFNMIVEEGLFHFLLGPTGSGKTLILESIAGLRKPHRGRIRIGEKEVQGLPPERREISYVPQDLALFPHLRVRENILYGLRAKNLDLKVYEKYVSELIEVMRIEPLLERYPANLSGGEKKRVALLRALAPKPKLLLLDEPLTGLDPSIKVEIQQVLKTLHATLHPTIVCVSHDFEDAYLLGERIFVFIDGKVQQVGTREDIFLRPQSRRVAQFLGAKNLYRGKVSSAEGIPQRVVLAVNGLKFHIPIGRSQQSFGPGEEVDLFVRPEEVMIIREGKPVKESLKQNIFPGEILNIIEGIRHHTVYFQTLEGGMTFEISIPNYAFRNLDLTVGRRVRIALREESLWVIPPDSQLDGERQPSLETAPQTVPNPVSRP